MEDAIALYVIGTLLGCVGFLISFLLVRIFRATDDLSKQYLKLSQDVGILKAVSRNLGGNHGREIDD